MIIKHSTGSYSIVFSQLEITLQDLPDNARIVTDENVFQAWKSVLNNWENILVIPAGEEQKSMDQLLHILRWLAQSKTLRQDWIVGLGGGVIGDLVGFAAATYMRGLSFAQVPTTLLAMVDSSVGGKVGIDLPEGKNLVGGFKPPEAVYVCIETLQTLPENRFIEGVSEIIKYGAIMDPALFKELESNPLDSKKAVSESERVATLELIKRCIRHKASIVERDEFEISGLRATLNFGHTVGHAIEKTMNYEGVSHGEAVAIGMIVESRLGEMLGKTTQGCTTRIKEVVENNGLPTAIPAGLTSKNLIESMRLDKKVGKNGLAFALIQNIGTCKLLRGVEDSVVLSVLDEFTNP